MGARAPVPLAPLPRLDIVDQNIITSRLKHDFLPLTDHNAAHGFGVFFAGDSVVLRVIEGIGAVHSAERLEMLAARVALMTRGALAAGFAGAVPLEFRYSNDMSMILHVEWMRETTTFARSEYDKEWTLMPRRRLSLFPPFLSVRAYGAAAQGTA